MKDQIFKPFKKVWLSFHPGETAAYFPVLNIDTVDIQSLKMLCYIFKEMTAPQAAPLTPHNQLINALLGTEGGMVCKKEKRAPFQLN